MSNYINNCPKCHYTARIQVFSGEIGIRAIQCTKCGYMGPKEKNTIKAIMEWNRLK